MKALPLLLSFSCLVLMSCGSDHKEEFVPGAAKITLDITAKTLSWDSIAGTETYNLYVKQVEDCEDVETAEFQKPTTDDTLVENVTSPFSIEEYTGCTTCYYASVVSVNNIGSGELSNAVGWQIRAGCP